MEILLKEYYGNIFKAPSSSVSLDTDVHHTLLWYHIDILSIEVKTMSLIDIAKDLGKKIATSGLVGTLGATSVLGAPVQNYDATTPTTTKYEQVVKTEYEKPSLDGYDYIGTVPYDVDKDGIKSLH